LVYSYARARFQCAFAATSGSTDFLLAFSTAFYKRKGAKIIINDLEDARKYTIGVIRGSNNEQFLISNGFKDIESVNVEKQNLKKLQLGRIDLWYTDNAQVSALMSEFSLKGLAEETFVTQESESYYAFSLGTPNSIVKKWQDALNALGRDGTVLKILKKYGLESMYPVLKD